MPKYIVTYAYDVPYYRDFVVEASNALDAEAKAQAALDRGAFSGVTGEPFYDNAGEDRVFAGGEASPQHIESYDHLIGDELVSADEVQKRAAERAASEALDPERAAPHF